MEINGVKIQVPEGMEHYIENGEIRFRKKLSLDDIYKELFLNKTMYYMSDSGWICEREYDSYGLVPYDIRTVANNCTSKKQVEKLLAIIKLMNVAKYLNEDWSPNWSNSQELKYYIEYVQINKELEIDCACKYNRSIVYFKTEEIAQRAIEILGEENIKLALSTDW